MTLITMDGRISMYVLLVCVWCLLDAGGLLMVVTAQTPPSVSAVILTPEADRKEGGQVDMRCTATNLQSDHIVEWRSTHPSLTLRWNDSTIAPNGRFMYRTSYPQSGVVVQDFTITDLQIDDYDEYVCNAKDPKSGGGHVVVATFTVILAAPSYPICSPSGPITVNTGAQLHMRCLSETNNPAVIAETHPMTNPSSYPWTSLTTNTVHELSLNLTVDGTRIGVTFTCTVLQGTVPDGSCMIGPISVTSTDSHTAVTSTTAHTTNTSIPPASNLAVIAGAVGGGVAALLIIILLILICRKRRLCHQTQKDQIQKPSTNHPEHSPNSFLDQSGVDIHDQSQASHLRYSTETPVPKPASSPTKPWSPEPVVYAQPNKHLSTVSTHSNAGGRYSENIDDVTSRSNPAFDSMDLDGSTEPNAPVKPVAKVRPSKKPIKPQPYQPKSERQSNPPDITNPDPMPPSPPTDHHESHPAPSNPTYAQVSRHKSSPPDITNPDPMPPSPPTDYHESHPAPSNPTSDQVSQPKSNPPDNPDGFVYADLDFQSDEGKDGGPRPQLSSDAVTYASVNMY